MAEADRIHTLERDVSDLRVANAALVTSMEHLSSTIEELSGIVKHLSSSMTFGRGAAWGVMGLVSAVSGLMAFAITSYFQRGS